MFGEVFVPTDDVEYFSPIATSSFVPVSLCTDTSSYSSSLISLISLFLVSDQYFCFFMLAFCGIFQVVARIAEELLFQLDDLAAHHQEADDVWDHRYPEDEIEELEDEFQTADGAEEDGGDVAELDQLGEEGVEEVFRLFSP